jgi:ACS family pantothenate transporter-like MFS transporter
MEVGMLCAVRYGRWLVGPLHGVCCPVSCRLGIADSRRWAHEICTYDNEERAIVIASMNEMAYVVQTWLPLIVWQQVEAPEYRKGYITVSFLSASMIVTALTIRVLYAREVSKGVPRSWHQDETEVADGSSASTAAEVELDVGKRAGPGS